MCVCVPEVQAATAAAMADSFNDTPAEGDGFTYDFMNGRDEVGSAGRAGGRG